MRNTIDMAREAGAIHIHESPKEFAIVGNDSIKAFEAFVRADERALAAPVQEPVAYEYGNDVFWHDSPDINDYIRANGNALVYAAPPNVATPLAAQRQWVGLTEARIEAIWKRVQANDFHDCVQPFAEAIESELKENNGG